MSDNLQGGAEPPFNPFLAIWTRPRQTIRRILDTDPQRHVLVLAALSGISETLSRMEMRGAGDEMTLPLILTIGVIAGPIGGLIGLYIWGALIWLTGRWIGGTAGAYQLRCAIAWSALPVIAALALYPPEIAVFGRELFFSELPNTEGRPGRFAFYMLVALIEAVLGAWTLVLMVRTIAEAQGYGSAWKGLGNLVLAGLLIAGPLLFLAFVI